MHLDWSTLALQTGNVLVLIWLLRRFLFRPVADIVAARRAAADALLADAAAARAKAEAQAAETATLRAALAADAERLNRTAHEAAETERQRLLAEAAQAAETLRAEAGAAIARERNAMRRALESEARSLAVAIAARLLTRVPADSPAASLLPSLQTALHTVPREQLQDFAAADAAIEVVTATPVPAEEQPAWQAELARALGTQPALRFRTDPGLIGGVELHGPHTVLRDSRRADLDRIARELAQEDEHAERALA